MQLIHYAFDTIYHTVSSDYIFQAVANRQLGKIYHSHDFYEWVIVLNGSCMQLINESEMYMESGTASLLCPGDCHCFLDQSEDVHILCLSATKQEVQRFLPLFHVDTDALHLSSVQLSLRDMRFFMDYADAACENDYKILHAHLIRIFSDKIEKKQTVPSALLHAMKEMSAPENLYLGLERFAQLSGYSKSQLNRLMQKHYATTSHDYILNMRLEAAYKALLYTTENIEEVAEKLGYASFSHFNKIFKKRYGITPAMLRKNHSVQTI